MSNQTAKRPRKPLDKFAFKKAVRAWSDRIGVRAKELHVRTMIRKWASCSSAGRVTFNSDLLQEAAEFREYVIVHELLHLQVPNHGKLFKSLLSAFLPEWEKVAEQHQRNGRNGLGMSTPL
jgi:predicted metal-dependent hydrolase